MPDILACPPSPGRSGMGRRAALAGAATLILAQAGRARAAGLPPAPAKPVLSVGGKIGATNDGGFARFDRAMLESLGVDGFSTSTPWYDGKVAFEGVPMARVMQAVGAAGDRVSAVALDDYASELPIADFAAFGTLLALKVGGKYITVADKGPCFILYPFDRYPQLQNARYYNRSVWQVNKLIVL